MCFLLVCKKGACPDVLGQAVKAGELTQAVLVGVHARGCRAGEL